MKTKKLKCSKCKKTAEVNLNHMPPLCKKHFLEVIEKRVRKDIRINKVFAKNDIIICSGEISFFLLKSILNKIPVNIILKNKTKLENPEKKPKSKSLVKNKIIVEKTADDYCCDFFEHIINKNKINKKEISIIRTLLDKEVEIFAKFNNLKFKPNKKNNEILKIIEEFDKLNPNARFAVFKDWLVLEKL